MTDSGSTLTGFEGKVAVVTGAGRMRSIGREIAVRLAEAGCDLVLTGSGRSPENYPEDERAAGWRDIESVAEEVRGLGRRAMTIVSDIANRDSMAELADAVDSEYGRLDILVNNASTAKGEDRKSVLDVDSDVWAKVIEVNLVGTFYCTKALLPLMIRGKKGGSIINISSIAGRQMQPEVSAYQASKAGVHALTGSLAAEVGEHQIRVNAIAPGIIDTSRMDDLGRDESWNKFIQTRVPLGRAGTGKDVAWLAAFLASDQADWITGQIYTIDGGTIRVH
ncbi:3-oxoacyl-[acyl-carrier protein] reductase/meso-butanediol dehydrogenase/(S,S)-butanediol dehydrogenase/diacetyl reductase [Antricoccus suffuscus]|uniref:3-oxoacyl-[acyl-carrier protein] reductase/meso-butanediol dehydrogenase/(S,S)-butanediol dehydrogenase/diacetyl reductase n=1 Tax=Antricoccus suffuscus TaxID=1629062 RepID=A0A2T1A4S9_9ACTN|nr:SDR family NAD(P)-dependent oxidoreductase [Antricoccus suffuscus]PRZ43338.1 3-oxoacyl-[acyl-carrier protein] reductase/meso-butanediol dehydrogenase/(S,S)-butanediol dehydrogenase/diacetyl reductase [Antricoccus suffuscus]